MTEEHPKDNAKCKSEKHSEHLCYFVSQGFCLSDDPQCKEMIENPKFKCLHCGRMAKCEDYLCEPVKL